jgi:hypothetical protein
VVVVVVVVAQARVQVQEATHVMVADQLWVLMEALSKAKGL